MLALTQLPPLEDCSLWLVDIDQPIDADAHALLSDDEHSRAARFAFDTHRHRYMAARAGLRQVLALHTGEDAARLRFDYGPQGKPSLATHPDCRFNMSHSAGHALIAVTASGHIGVDIEMLRPVPDAQRMALELFDEDERAALAAFAASSIDAMSRAFLCGWTRKEAVLKALGTGFSNGAMPSTGIDAQTRTIPVLSADGLATRARVHSFELAQINAFCSVARLPDIPTNDEPAVAERLAQSHS